jgi:hypothetical protein
MKICLNSGLALAACAAFSLAVVGCEHRVLLLPVDAAFSDGKDAREAASPDLAAEPLVEVYERAPEIPDDAGLEAQLEVGDGETGTEAAPEAALEARPESKPEVATDRPSETVLDGGLPGCTSFASTTMLAELPGAMLPATLLVHGDTVYVAASTFNGTTTPPTTSLLAVTVSTGKTKTFALGTKVPNSIVASGDALFFIQGATSPGGGGSWSFKYPDVARLDLATGQTSIVDSELVPSGFTILSVVGNSREEVFWSMQANLDGTASVIRRWDQVKSSVETILELEQLAIVSVDQDHLYWSGLSSSGLLAFFSAATSGGPISMIHEWSTSLAQAPMLGAVDGQSLYYTLPNGSTHSIHSIPKGGGDSLTVVDSAEPSVFASYTIDDTHVYWVDLSAPGDIRRATKTGDGVIETISTGGASIEDLAVDGCNIYWITSGKPRLNVRSK